MPITGFVDITIDTATLTFDSAEFERAWMAGFLGAPLPDDASNSFREAYATGAGRAVSNSEWELARLREELDTIRHREGEQTGQV